MPTPTYIPLATITFMGSASQVVFSNIPASYGDLILIGNWQNSSTSSAGRLQLNGDTASNYNGVWINGTGSASSSGSESGQTSARIAGASVGPDNTYTNTVIIRIADYSSTDKQKTILSKFGSGNREVQMTTSRWASTTAVNSIKFFDILGQTFQAGATFSLYGVAK
jgi:hypothetical protein